MAWQDFQLHFRSLYVCRIYPPEMRYAVRGQWRGPTAGGCQDFDTWHLNPQFHLKAVGPDARAPLHVFVTLTQVKYLRLPVSMLFTTLNQVVSVWVYHS